MSKESALAQSFGARLLQARWVLTAEVSLASACHIGGGEAGMADLTILRDPCTRNAMIPGTTWAGALRAALDRAEPGQARVLFGGAADGDEPSCLFTFDSVATASDVEVRDGVALDTATGLAASRAKYDLEVIPAGTRFPLRLELEIPEAKDETLACNLLATALSEANFGQLSLGARRNRGLGALAITSWRARRWNLADAQGWREFLRSDPADPLPQTVPPHPGPADAMGLEPRQDLPTTPTIRLDLELSSVLVRQAVVAPSKAGGEPDVTQLQSGGRPVLPGSSLGGVLRARATQIARLVRADQGDAEHWVAYLFGSPRETKNPLASRVRISDAVLSSGKGMTRTRVRIDRFTGGALDTALFQEEPLFAPSALVELTLRTRHPNDEAHLQPAMGLLLLAIKDLICGDLAVGGAGSIGHGAARGTVTVVLDNCEYRLVPGVETPPQIDSLIASFHTVEVLNEP